MIIARQRLGKHIPAVTNEHATIEKLPFLCNGAVNTTIEKASPWRSTKKDSAEELL
jgi:hypothetical protein